MKMMKEGKPRRPQAIQESNLKYREVHHESSFPFPVVSFARRTEVFDKGIAFAPTLQLLGQCYSQPNFLYEEHPALGYTFNGCALKNRNLKANVYSKQPPSNRFK